MVPEQPDCGIHPVQEILPCFRVPVQPGILTAQPESESRQHGVPQIPVFTAVHHILKHNHAQAVTFIVELFRLDLDMLPQHIEAQRLHRPDIVRITFR